MMIKRCASYQIKLLNSSNNTSHSTNNNNNNNKAAQNKFMRTKYKKAMREHRKIVNFDNVEKLSII